MENQYRQNTSDRVQDAVMLLLAIVVSILFFGIPICNILGISLQDVINWFR